MSDLPEQLAARDGLVEACHPGIGARHDQNVRPRFPRIHCSANTHQRFVPADDGFAFGVPAAFRRDLIFQHDAGEPGPRVSLDRALDVLRAAESGIAVADDRNRDRAADVRPLIDELSIGDQPRVGHPEPGRRDGKAAHEPDLESGLLDCPCGHGVVTARHDEDPGLCEPLFEPFSR
jgi:hypothetical protein